MDKYAGQPHCTSVVGSLLHLHWRSVDVVWISGTAVHWNSGQWTHWTLTDHCRATTVFCRCTAGQSRTTRFIKSRHWDKSCLPLDCGATYTFVDGSIGWRPTQNHGQDKHDGYGCEHSRKWHLWRRFTQYRLYGTEARDPEMVTGSRRAGSSCNFKCRPKWATVVIIDCIGNRWELYRTS